MTILKTNLIEIPVAEVAGQTFERVMEFETEDGGALVLLRATKWEYGSQQRPYWFHDPATLKVYVQTKEDHAKVLKHI